jgi:hypothetical protein
MNGKSVTVIWDRVKVNSLTASKARLDVGATVTLSVQLIYEYDGAYISSGTFTLNGLALTYSGSNGVWTATDSKNTAQSVTYNSVAGTEGTYGLTAVNMNGKSVTVIWDTQPSASPTSPSNGFIFNPSVSVTFSWTFSDPDSGDSQSAYQLQIGNSGFTTIYVDTGKVTSSAGAVTLTVPSAPGVYYWRVMVWDSINVNGSWSVALTFKINAPPNVDTGKVSGSRTSATIVLPSTSGYYYWRVMVWDNHDLPSGWTAGRLIIVGYMYVLNGAYYENGTKTSFAVTVTAYFEQLQADQAEQ